jgi:hypothetical protein
MAGGEAEVVNLVSDSDEDDLSAAAAKAAIPASSSPPAPAATTWPHRGRCAIGGGGSPGDAGWVATTGGHEVRWVWRAGPVSGGQRRRDSSSGGSGGGGAAGNDGRWEAYGAETTQVIERAWLAYTQQGGDPTLQICLAGGPSPRRQPLYQLNFESRVQAPVGAPRRVRDVRRQLRRVADSNGAGEHTGSVGGGGVSNVDSSGISSSSDDEDCDIYGHPTKKTRMTADASDGEGTTTDDGIAGPAGPDRMAAANKEETTNDEQVHSSSSERVDDLPDELIDEAEMHLGAATLEWPGAEHGAGTSDEDDDEDDENGDDGGGGGGGSGGGGGATSVAAADSDGDDDEDSDDDDDDDLMLAAKPPQPPPQQSARTATNAVKRGRRAKAAGREPKRRRVVCHFCFHLASRSLLHVDVGTGCTYALHGYLPLMRAVAVYSRGCTQEQLSLLLEPSLAHRAAGCNRTFKASVRELLQQEKGLKSERWEVDEQPPAPPTAVARPHPSCCSRDGDDDDDEEEEEPPPPQVPYTAHWLRRVVHPRYASAAAAAAGEVGQIFGSTRALFSPF